MESVLQMSNRRLFVIIGVTLVLIILVMFVTIYSFAFFSIHVGESYNNKSYYMSEEFRTAAILTWQEYKDNNPKVNWLSYDDDTNDYYIATIGGNQIVSPSDNVKYLFDHGALGLSFSGDALMIIDYMSYGEEKGCIVSPVSSYRRANRIILWETSGFIAYPFSQDR